MLLAGTVVTGVGYWCRLAVLMLLLPPLVLVLVLVLGLVELTDWTLAHITNSTTGSTGRPPLPATVLRDVLTDRQRIALHVVCPMAMPPHTNPNPNPNPNP